MTHTTQQKSWMLNNATGNTLSHAILHFLQVLCQSWCTFLKSCHIVVVTQFTNCTVQYSKTLVNIFTLIQQAASCTVQYAGFLLHVLSRLGHHYKKTWEIQSRNYLSFVLKSVALIFLHIFHSMHYNSITVIYTKKCTQSC